LEALVVAPVGVGGPGGVVLTHRSDHDVSDPGITTTIAQDSRGPLLVRGELVLDSPDGVLAETRAALCACGRTQNRPFCDGGCGVNAGASGGTRDQAEESP
jgi:CDGSH-type Zn-finger protein